MCNRVVLLTFTLLVHLTIGVRINFTNCHHSEWSCVNNVPSDIVYTCSAVKSNDFIIHLKDFYTDHIHSITIQNCRDLRVVLDCPILQLPSRLQKFVVKDCDRLEFISLSSSSLLQTPPEVRIENVREIVSFPRNTFKSPNSNTELKCMGAPSFKKLHVINSKINSINTNAIHNVTGIKSIEFENVTITDIQSHGIEVVMGNNNTLFSIINSKIENIDFKAVTVQSYTVKISSNTFGDVIANVMNITSDNLYLIGNTFKEVCSNGISTNAVRTDILDNTFSSLKSNALANIKCLRKRSNRKYINFLRNTFRNIEPYSLYFDHASCKSAGSQISFRENKLDCLCRNISFLNMATYNEQNNLILNLANNNTCLVTFCLLPVEVVKLLLELDMCHLNLDPQVMCLMYNDKQSNNNNNNEVTTDEEVTEPAPTFYLIRQANTLNSDGVMTEIDKDDLLKDSHLNLTNRTLIKFVFDSSKDFVETLRSTSRTRTKPTEKPVLKEEYVRQCIGTQCRNDNVYNRQRALDFYKYVYAQLRTPRENDNKINKT